MWLFDLSRRRWTELQQRFTSEASDLSSGSVGRSAQLVAAAERNFLPRWRKPIEPGRMDVHGFRATVQKLPCTLGLKLLCKICWCFYRFSSLEVFMEVFGDFVCCWCSAMTRSPWWVRRKKADFKWNLHLLCLKQKRVKIRIRILRQLAGVFFSLFSRRRSILDAVLMNNWKHKEEDATDLVK